MVVAIKWSKAHKKGVEQFAPINEKNIRDCIFAVPLQTNCTWATFRFHPFIKGLLITFYPMSSSTTFACGVQWDSFLSWMSLKWHEKVQVLFSLFCSQTNFCDYSGEAQLRLRQSWNQGGVSILGRLPTPQTDLVVGFENAQIQWRGNPLLFVLLDDLREKAQFVTWLFETVNLFSPFLAACTNRSNATQNLVRGVVSWTQRKCSTREGPWGDKNSNYHPWKQDLSRQYYFALLFMNIFANALTSPVVVFSLTKHANFS